MKKLSFSIPSGKPQSKSEPIHNTFESSSSTTQNDVTKHSITQFHPSEPLTPPNPKITIPPLQNQWNPLKPQQHCNQRRTPTETELLRKLKLKDDLQSLPDDRGFEDFNDVPVPSFGAALLAGYGWTNGMGIGKNAKDDVKVLQFNRPYAGEGLGFVRGDAPVVNHNGQL